MGTDGWLHGGGHLDLPLEELSSSRLVSKQHERLSMLALGPFAVKAKPFWAGKRAGSTCRGNAQGLWDMSLTFSINVGDIQPSP